MQTAADLIASTAKFATCVQDGHDHFECGETRPLVMFFYGDATSIILNCYRAVGMDNDLHRIGIPGHYFINAVIDDFGNEVMQTTLVGCSNIHAGTHAHGFQAFENLNVLL